MLISRLVGVIITGQKDGGSWYSVSNNAPAVHLVEISGVFGCVLKESKKPARHREGSLRRPRVWCWPESEVGVAAGGGAAGAGHGL